MSREARVESLDQGRGPVTSGWFVLNLADASWYESDKFGRVGRLEGEYTFPHTGVNLRVVNPGQPACYYHEESRQEDFLVLSGECLLLVDEEERPLKTWDFVHCPPGVPHVFLGAGDGPCVILMIGSRDPGRTIRYPVSELARRHEAGVEEETDSPAEAYRGCAQRTPVPARWPVT